MWPPQKLMLSQIQFLMIVAPLPVQPEVSYVIRNVFRYLKYLVSILNNSIIIIECYPFRQLMKICHGVLVKCLYPETEITIPRKNSKGNVDFSRQLIQLPTQKRWPNSVKIVLLGFYQLVTRYSSHQADQLIIRRRQKNCPH